MTHSEPFSFRSDAGVEDRRLGGYSFVTVDGDRGHVVEEIDEGEIHHLVVQLPGGRGQRAVPVGVVASTDHNERTISLLVSTADLIQLPEFPWEEELADHHVATIREWFTTFGYQGSPPPDER